MVDRIKWTILEICAIPYLCSAMWKHLRGGFFVFSDAPWWVVAMVACYVEIPETNDEKAVNDLIEMAIDEFNLRERQKSRL